MISVSIKNTKKLFLTSKTKFEETDEKLDIIISPEYYWVRKFELPIKTEAQARHVLPTLFEDIVDDITILSYKVIKLEENQFLCFAYNNKKIYGAIKNLNINISNIISIYFAQNECKEYKSFKIDKQYYMYTSDDILVKAPIDLFENAISLESVLENIIFSPHKLQIKLYNNILNMRYYYFVFFIFISLIFINGIKYFDYSERISKTENQIFKIKQQNNLPNSLIQTNAMLREYEKDISSEKRKREAIEYILKNSKNSLKKLILNVNKIELLYESKDKNEFERYLKKEFKKVQVILIKDKLIKVSIIL